MDAATILQRKVTMPQLAITPVTNAAEQRTFIDYGYQRNAGDPHWVPPLRQDMQALLTPGKNPFFEHARQQLFLARRGGAVVGRISAHIDELALRQPPEKGLGPGTGNWGLFEAADAEVAAALIATAEDWLRGQQMTRVIAPMSLSLWDEPGLLTLGFDHSPTVMMGHNLPEYEGWITAQGYHPLKRLHSYELDILKPFPPLINRIVAAGAKNPRIRIRQVNKRRFDAEAKIILDILNDAWADNWGHVPITDGEIAHIGKKLKPLVYEDLIMIAELDGQPVAFMLVLPDLNEPLKSMGGNLFPFGWAKLLWWLRKPRVRAVRVPLMGVLKQHQSSRVASQLAFMLVDAIRRNAVANYGAVRGDFGWVLEDNQGMLAIAEAIGSNLTRSYVIYEKLL